MSAAMIRARLEEMSFASDARNCDRDEAPVLYLPNGEERKLPTKWQVCSVCNGEGTHVNPSIDCGGLSSEDFDEDPDFAESYMAGHYDVPCNRCGGRTTEHAVDWNALSDEERAAWERQCNEEAQDRACYLAEIRAGA